MNTLLSRQPIFDACDRIAGYELLCRDGPGDGSGGGAARESADRVVVDAVLGIGLQRLAEGQPAWLTVGRDMLSNDGIGLLDRDSVIVQLPADVQRDAAVLESCRALVARGYRIALDDFAYTAGAAPLLGLADIVRIDVRAHAERQLAEQVEHLRNFRVRMLAENVENRTVHEACVQLGFRFFQGLHFSRPETVSRRDLTVEHIRTLRLMTLVRDLAVSEHAIGEAFRTDAALSYKLLRMVNSASNGGKDLQSIAHAVGLLGRQQLYRWLALLLISGGAHGSVDQEIACATLVRARLCELLATAGQRKLPPGTLFMVGLLSALDTYYNMPVEEIVAQLRLSEDVNQALLHRAGPLGGVLALVLAFEDGDWEALDARCGELAIDNNGLTNLYLDSLAWAHERVRLFGTDD